MLEDTTKSNVPEEAGEAAVTNTVPPKLRAAKIGQRYEVELTATGGRGSKTWTVRGMLPTGFRLEGNRILCDRVPAEVESRFVVRVTDAEQNFADAETSISSNDPQQTISDIRKRGVFLFEAIVLALAVSGLLLLLKLGVDFESFLYTEASRLRTAFGFPVPSGRPDWYILVVLTLTPALGVVAMFAAWVWYRRLWTRKLRELWGPAPGWKRFARIQPVPPRCPTVRECPHCDQKVRYLRELLASNVWIGRWDRIRASGQVNDRSPSTLDPQHYVAVSNAVFVLLEKDIVERALTTGLLVGVGRSRWFDFLTIVVSSFEMQMFVLTRLGKRPGLKLWWRMLHRCSASLFVNAYLTRQDVFALNLAIKKAAWGLHAAASSAQFAADHLTDAISHHHEAIHEHASALLDHAAQLDHPFDSSDMDADELHHGLGGAWKIVAEFAAFSFSTGAVALNQIASFVEHWSNALLQGALASGIIYWHGCDLAAEVLAINGEHRQSDALDRGVFDCAWRMAQQAGEILRAATRQLRSMYRERRMRIAKKLVDRGMFKSLMKKASDRVRRTHS